MKVLKLCATLLIAGICSVAFAQSPAAEPPSHADVLRLFEAMHLQKQMDQMMGMMTTQIKQQLHASLEKRSPRPSPAEEAKLEASAGDALTIYPIAEMLDDMIPIYQHHMSKTDVDAIVAFYSSPAGQHLLEQSPVMMQETMSTIIPKVNARTQAYIARVTKESEGTTPAPSPSKPAPAPKN